MILISGEALIDLIPDPKEDGRYDAVLGGSPFNVAMGLGRLGATVGFVSRLSKDPNGEALAQALAKDNVNLEHVERDPRPSTLAFVMRGTAQTGSRYSFYIDSTAYDGAWPFPSAWPDAAKHLHIGSFACVDPRHIPAVTGALERAKGNLSVSFDPNVRPFVTPDREAVLATCERHVRLATLVKASEEDLEWLYPSRSPEESLKAWAQMGPRFVIATLGAKGAFAYLGSQRFDIPGRKIDLVDTVGAGDSFMSGLLSIMDREGALGAGGPAPSADQLGKWLAFAARTSAITCSRKGSNPPTLAEAESAPD